MMVTWESFARTGVLFHVMGINVNKNAIAVERYATMLPVVHLQVTNIYVFKNQSTLFSILHMMKSKILNDF